jgi:hypothetical protein
LGTANASDKVEHAELQEHLTQAMAALPEKMPFGILSEPCREHEIP